MNIEKLFKLIDAGFTKDEIIKLTTIDTTTASTTEAAAPTTASAKPKAPAAAPDPAPAKPEAPAAAPTPASAKPIESSPAWADQLIKSNENLAAAIKSINLLNSSVPAPAGDDITQVLAQIIDPEGSAMKERK